MVTYVATYGKDPKIAEKVGVALLKQEIEVVHTCLDLSKAKDELVSLCAGDTSVVPASELGSNFKAQAGERKVPEAVLFGGDFADSEFDEISAAVKAKNDKIHFVKCTKLDVLKTGSLGPNPDAIAKVYRKKLDALSS